MHTLLCCQDLHCLQPSDEYGSPSLDELSEFSKLFADEYSLALGSAADDVSVEVSSPVSPSFNLRECS